MNMNYKTMREYSHEEFVELVKNINEEELLNFSKNYGGFPVLFRMSLDERICHIPFIQPGAAVVIRNEKGEILLQGRTDRDQWGLPGGCQDLGEDLRDTAVREAYEETGVKLDANKLELIDIVSGKSRRNSYPNGDIVYNNTALYLADVNSKDLTLKGDTETKALRFFDITRIPHKRMDSDLIDTYIFFLNKKNNRT